jgi:hypothetical protein
MQVLNHQPSNHQKVLLHIHVCVLHNARTHRNYDLITFHTLQQKNALGKLLHSILSPTQHDYEGTKPWGIKKKPTQVNIWHTTATLVCNSPSPDLLPDTQLLFWVDHCANHTISHLSGTHTHTHTHIHQFYYRIISLLYTSFHRTKYSTRNHF